MRYLLIADEWDKDYFDKALFVKADEIFQEVEQLRGDESYKKFIRTSDFELNDNIKITLLAGVLELYEINPILAKETLIKLGLKYKDKKEVLKALNNRIFDKQVEQAKKEGDKKKPLTFEEVCIPIEQYYKIQIDRDITTAKFIAWENRIKKAV